MKSWLLIVLILFAGALVTCTRRQRAALPSPPPSVAAEGMTATSSLLSAPVERHPQLPSSRGHGSCRSVNDLEDQNCTPGVINPKVTQANIHQTICAPGFSSRTRELY